MCLVYFDIMLTVIVIDFDNDDNTDNEKNYVIATDKMSAILFETPCLCRLCHDGFCMQKRISARTPLRKSRVEQSMQRLNTKLKK